MKWFSRYDQPYSPDLNSWAVLTAFQNMVHALEDVADALSRLIHPDAVGVIDVAAAVGITVDKIAAEIEQG